MAFKRSAVRSRLSPPQGTREKRLVSKETSLFSYVCFVDWHIPATQAHSPTGRSDFLNAPFFMPIFRYHHNRKEFPP